MKPDAAIHKIMLIMPPVTISRDYTKEIQPPLGLAYIAAVLEKSYTVKILDAACEGWQTETPRPDGTFTFGLTPEAIRETIREFSPDLVGVSCLFSLQAPNSHAVCALVKEVDAGIVTVMGGAHPTALPEKTLQDPAVDIVVLGEGEAAMPDLLEALNQDKSLASIDGIAYKENGAAKINPKTKFIEDLDSLPYPARHLLPMEKYFRINLPHGVSTRFSPNTPVVTSRGCPANCIFCSIHCIWGFKYRGRSPQNIIGELRFLKNTYGVREIQFEDDNLTFDKQRAVRLFNLMIQEKLGLAWTTPNGVALWALDQELLSLMKESGCYRLCLAVESGDQKFLSETIRKPLNLEKVKVLTRMIRRLGLETDAFFVVGFPHETKEQMHNTFRFALDLDVDNVSFYIATPYPGTELYEAIRREGRLPEDFSLDRLGVKKAALDTDYFTGSQIEKMVAYYTLKHKVSLLWRNPPVFYRKVIRRFFKTPGFFVSFAKKLLQKLLFKQ